MNFRFLLLFFCLSQCLSASKSQHDQKILMLIANLKASLEVSLSSSRFESPAIKGKIEEHVYRRFWQVVFDTEDIFVFNSKNTTSEVKKIMFGLFEIAGPFQILKLNENRVSFLVHHKDDVRLVICQGEDVWKRVNYLTFILRDVLETELADFDHEFWDKSYNSIYDKIRDHLTQMGSLYLLNEKTRKRVILKKSPTAAGLTLTEK